MLRNVHIVLVAGILAGAHVAGATAVTDDRTLAPPPTYKANGVTVDEHLGAKVPFDARFRTQDGKQVTLGEVLQGELPTILTFNYSDCPMLCSQQLNGLSNVLPALAEPVVRFKGDKPVAFKLGTQFRLVTIDLEPTEPLDKLIKMRERYVAKLPEAQRASARAGWTFLAAATPGDGAQIARVEKSVGFSYVYIKERAEWAHPAALIFLSTQGEVTRYVYGIEFEPQMMRESIVKAGTATPATAVGFMNRCYHFDPNANSRTKQGVFALRIGALGFVVALVSMLGVFHIRRRRRTKGAQGVS
jgi:protein SCO1/2